MADLTERRLGWGFGLLGAVLIVVGAIVSLVTMVADFALRSSNVAVAMGTTAVLLFVVGGLAGFFAYLGYKTWSDRPIVSGILLVVVAAIGWVVLGMGTNVIALVGALFVFLAGVLYLIGPAVQGARHALATA